MLPLWEIYSAPEWGEWTKLEVAFLRRSLVGNGDVRGVRIGDFGCGVGRHSIGLAKEGFHVTGFDVNSSYLKMAQEAARQCQVAVEFRERDVLALNENGVFDHAICLNASFGHFTEPADELRFLEAIRNSIRSGGKLVIDYPNGPLIYQLAKPWFRLGSPMKYWETRSDGSIVYQSIRFPNGKRMIQTEWGYQGSKSLKPISSVESLRFYTRRSFEKLLKKAGFTIKGLVGSLTGDKYNPKRSFRFVFLVEMK